MADEIWVVNASPLIALAKIGHLDLLEGSSICLVIPEAVAAEVLAGNNDDPAKLALQSGFGGTPVVAPIDTEVGQWGLGRGESAVLSLARSKSAAAIIDDRDARRSAKAMRIPLIGTLGVILRARAESRISSAAIVLHQLRQQGFRLDDNLITEALRQSFGEIWKG